MRVKLNCNYRVCSGFYGFIKDSSVVCRHASGKKPVSQIWLKVHTVPIFILSGALFYILRWTLPTSSFVGCVFMAYWRQKIVLCEDKVNFQNFVCASWQVVNRWFKDSMKDFTKESQIALCVIDCEVLITMAGWNKYVHISLLQCSYFLPNNCGECIRLFRGFFCFFFFK